MGDLNPEKGNQGPPSKIHDWLEACREVFDFYKPSMDIWIFTDEELVFLVNERLRSKGKYDKAISKRTFVYWKERAQEGYFNELPVHFQEFLRLYKKACLLAKQAIMQELRTEKNAWQRWAWIMERKFSDWQLEHKSKKVVEGKIEQEIEYKVNIYIPEYEKGYKH